MKLLALELAGFKSFADPTEFKFDAGITGIVGPNGCGKSNVVDAVKWVLGEMSAKSLRGDVMLDVIFSGSAGRKPMGLAEVSLRFDNGDRRLPVPTDEVKITRRLYRDATSEYLVNNQVVRLKDVREIFLDTGVGVDAYSVMEQGRISALLDANSLERREIFEEAAGISRFKARKKETLRRLEKTSENLAQTQVVLDEVERQLRSVKVQAGRARSYQEYAGQLRLLRRDQSLHEYDQLHRRLMQITQERTDAAESAARQRRQLDRLRQQQQDLQLEVQALQDAAHAAERELAALDQQRGTLEQQADFSLQQAGQLAEQQTLLRRRSAELAARGAELRTQLEQREAALNEVRQRVQAGEQALTRAADAQEQAQCACARINHQLEQDQARAIELLRETSRQQNQLQALVLQGEDMARQMERLNQRRADLTAQATELQTRCAQLAAERDARAAQSETLRREAEKSRQEQQANNRKMAELSEEISRDRERRGALESRRSVLQDLQRRREGFSEAVQQVLQRRDTEPAFTVLKGVVGDFIDADLEVAPLIEAALGSALQTLIVDNATALTAHMEVWRAVEGRVRVLALDQLPPYREDFSLPPGTTAVRALDLVRFAPDLAPLALALLGRTFVVAQWAEALALAAAGPRDCCYVTRAGEVLRADGTMELGGRGRPSGVIWRRGELTRLTAEAAVVEKRLTTLAEALARCDSEAQQLAARQQAQRDQLYQVQTAHAQSSAHWQQADQTLQRVQAELPLLQNEFDDWGRQAADNQAKQQQQRTNIAGVEKEARELERIVSEAARQLETARQAAAGAAEELTRLRVALGQAQEQRSAVARDLAATQQSIRELDAELQAGTVQTAALEERIGRLNAAAAEARGQAAALVKRRQEAEQAATANAGRLAEIRQRQAQTAEQLAALQTEVETLVRREHELSLAENEASVRLETLVERTTEELQLNVVELHRDYQAPPETDWAAVAAQVADLRGRLARLGHVNLEAIDELSRLEERQKFLAVQITDVRDAQRQLEELIAKIDADSRCRFEETFAAVRREFQEMFRKLFGGGKADVLLENPEDMLESGIEILARPPGKELQSISLLSGGEKALTALALVLAIFRSKPSPFCLLDEVDAPLDEANTGRFAAILQEFLDRSQFILITHNKRMMGVAGLLYGVTMQEQGVSRKVAVRFEDRSLATKAA